MSKKRDAMKRFGNTLSEAAKDNHYCYTVVDAVKAFNKIDKELGGAGVTPSCFGSWCRGASTPRKKYHKAIGKFCGEPYKKLITIKQMDFGLTDTEQVVVDDKARGNGSLPELQAMAADAVQSAFQMGCEYERACANIGQPVDPVDPVDKKLTLEERWEKIRKAELDLLLEALKTDQLDDRGKSRLKEILSGGV